MNNEWYKDWFASEDYLDVYRHRNSEDTDQLVNLISKNIQINLNANILDAACGAGRYSIKFAELGYNVSGFDLSDTLLNIAKSEAEKKNLNIDFVRSDLREYRSNKKFDLVLSLFTSFGYFESDEENFLFPQNAFNLLKENGYYVLDYLNKNELERNLIETTEKTVNDKNIFEERKIENGRVIKNINIEKADKSYRYLESVKLYSKDELVSGFRNIGFKVVNVFGDYLGNNFEIETSDRCIIIFQK